MPSYPGLRNLPDHGVDDWRDLKSWTTEASRPNLILELLADAEAFAARGAARPALVQAVAALEVAIVRLYESQFWQKAVKSRTAQAVWTGEKLHERVGLRGALHTLLPAVVGDSNISCEVLIKCQNAVDARNAIVHKGSRLPPEAIEPHLWPIRVLCEHLLHLTKLTG